MCPAGRWERRELARSLRRSAAPDPANSDGPEAATAGQLIRHKVERPPLVATATAAHHQLLFPIAGNRNSFLRLIRQPSRCLVRDGYAAVSRRRSWFDQESCAKEG